MAHRVTRRTTTTRQQGAGQANHRGRPPKLETQVAQTLEDVLFTCRMLQEYAEQVRTQTAPPQVVAGFWQRVERLPRLAEQRCYPYRAAVRGRDRSYTKRQRHLAQRETQQTQMEL